MSDERIESTVEHQGVSLAVSRGGHGRPVVFCPGLTSTQAELAELLVLLRRNFDVLAVDLRGHGFSGGGTDGYSFDTMVGDFAAVVNEARRVHWSSAPVLVGHSYGADLIVHYASGHSEGVSGLVLIDGALPLPEPFITGTNQAEFRALWESVEVRQTVDRNTGRQVKLTAQEILNLNIELDAVRSGVLDKYRGIMCPIHLIVSTRMAGDAVTQAEHYNQLWRAGIERLTCELPYVDVSWVDATHGLVITHASEVARIIGSTLTRC